MNTKQVRRATQQAHRVESGSTYAMLFLFLGAVMLGVAVLLHGIFGIVSDLLTGVI